MRLDDGQGATLQLSVDGYQFPDSDGYWDSNWLMVRGTVEHPRGSWTFRDPCLTTFEIEQLAAWLDGVANDQVDPKLGLFTEPNLHFEQVTSPEPSVRVTLAYESAPPWLAAPSERLDGTAVEFPVRLNEPRAAARSLRELLSAYPIRGEPELDE